MSTRFVAFFEVDLEWLFDDVMDFVFFLPGRDFFCHNLLPGSFCYDIRDSTRCMSHSAPLLGWYLTLLEFTFFPLSHG